jgi:hypothetical protein
MLTGDRAFEAVGVPTAPNLRLEKPRRMEAAIDERAIVVPLTLQQFPQPTWEPTLASSKEARDRAEAQFHKTLKAAWKGKQATSQYEAEARVARDKISRLKSLRLAREAVEIKTEVAPVPAAPKRKRAPPSKP